MPLAKTLAALDVLSDGRVIAGVGPGSSERDYDAVGVPFEERWERFDEAVAILRSLLRDEPPPETRRHYALPGSPLAPARRRPGGVPVWIGSWGSAAGLRRVARLGDGWLASAYNTTPDGFRAAKQSLSEQLDARGKDPDRFPNALATMWTWISEDARDADRVLREVLAPMLRRDPDSLSDQLCVGPAAHCAELLSRYAEAGCDRVYSGHSATSRGRSSSQRRPCSPPLRRESGRPNASVRTKAVAAVRGHSRTRPRPALHRLAPALHRKQPRDRPPKGRNGSRFRTKGAAPNAVGAKCLRQHEGRARRERSKRPLIRQRRGSRLRRRASDCDGRRERPGFGWAACRDGLPGTDRRPASILRGVSWPKP